MDFSTLHVWGLHYLSIHFRVLGLIDWRTTELRCLGSVISLGNQRAFLPQPPFHKYTL